MDLRWWWAGLLWVGLVLALGLMWWRARRPVGDDVLLVAHTDLLRRSTRYAALVRSEARRTATQLAAVGLVLAGSGLLVARLSETDTTAGSVQNRDVMLCLDVSSSMTDSDADLVAAYAQIAAGLEGDRVGLTVWNGAAIAVFPLTDDYGYVSEELTRATRALHAGDYDFIAGTVLGGRSSSSLIGDGLASCVQRFDQPGRDRTRVVVLASDNDVQGSPVYTLDEAAALAGREGVVVDCIAPSTIDGRDFAALRQACTGTGGSVVRLDDSAGPGALRDQIDRMRRTESAATPRISLRDHPGVGAGVAALGLALLVGGGPSTRWRRR